MICRLLLIIALLISFVSSASYGQNFTISGRITGLQKGDTLHFDRIILPVFDRDPAFDIIVEQPDSFSYSGMQDHDQNYSMTYLPKAGSVADSDRCGIDVIVRAGDKITLSGNTDEIYYCRLGGGIYSDSLLDRYLQLSDSLGLVRCGYLRKSMEALAANDTVSAIHYSDLFNNFGRSGSDPGFERLHQAKDAYRNACPAGSLYLLVSSLEEVNYSPLDKSKEFYESLNPELKDSYYGQLYNDAIYTIENLAVGKPVPPFSVITTDDKKLTDKDFNGKYLLIYHWGLCPGSMMIDRNVRELYDKYSGKGLEILGLTESMETISQLYDQLSDDALLPNGENMKLTLANMLHHPWSEVETATSHPDNKLLSDTFRISGWPFFILIGPDGKICVRGFSEAFTAAGYLLEKELK